MLSTEKAAAEVFRHELAHRLLHQRVGDVPPWLDEGFADYFSVLPTADGKIALGGLLALRGRGRCDYISPAPRRATD